MQVLQEFYVQATSATRTDALGHRQAAQLVQSFTRFPVQETTASNGARVFVAGGAP